MHKWIARFAISISLICLSIVFSIGISIVTYPKTVASGYYDCAIVLGAGVDGVLPSPIFQARIEHGVNLFASGIVRHIIFTGGLGEQADIAESEAGRKFAMNHGVPASAISTESVSRTTLQNLVEAKRIMDSQALKTALLVSDPFHLRRGSTMAKDLGINASASATPATRYQSWSTKFPFLVREIYFTIHYGIFHR